MVTFTDSAARKVQYFFHSEAEAKGKHLRIAVVSGGCSGFEYSFAFDDKKETDTEVPLDGFTVLIDPQSAAHLDGARVDYSEEATRAGFKIDNPNAVSSCACGQSNQFA
ncbi:MAG: iron-sulfur cluster assembly accessory protein [Elusimicrobiota bacterium]